MVLIKLIIVPTSMMNRLIMARISMTMRLIIALRRSTTKLMCCVLPFVDDQLRVDLFVR